MAGRVVGKGRGAVYAAGQVYLEGATIPADVQVGDHVFEDVDPVEGNVAVTFVRPTGPDGPVAPETVVPPETPQTQPAKKAAAPRKRGSGRKSTGKRAAKKAAAGTQS